VVRTDGTMGGFRWGLRIKESLLAREKQGLAAG
jgi:methylated-DNA-[protein]-cysteine S-methyltransferase